MKLIDLEESVSKHSGVFHCIGREGDITISKVVSFEHLSDESGSISDVPDIGMPKEFYSTFSNLTLYHLKESGDSAFYIASPEEWESLLDYFVGGIDDLDAEEQEELLPEWIDDCIAIGEIPHSGNYLLVPTVGVMAGPVFKFEYDGFEFIDHASNIKDFVTNMLDPDSEDLTRMASHMTLTESNEENQWWVEEMRDKNGNIVRIDA